jgi:hypothetical protein
MRRVNCYCGVVAHANCTRCGNGVCYMHHNDKEHSSAWFYRTWGQGKTLQEAAYVRGYWSAPRDRFLCKDCRDADGKQHGRQTIAQSRQWHRNPYLFAMQAASRGYVIAEPGFTLGQAIEAWLGFSWRPPIEDVTVPKQPPGRRQLRGGAAEDRYQGWSFPNTIATEGWDARGESRVWSWTGRTDVLTDGRVLQLGKLATPPLYGGPHRIIVEMARKVYRARRQSWQGPPENWDT